MEFEELLVDDHRQRPRRDQLRRDHARQRIDPMKLAHQDEVVHGQGRDRDHEARQDRPPEDPATWKIELRNRVAGADSHGDDDERHRAGGDERVQVPEPDLGPQQHVDVVLDGEMVGPELHAGPHDLVLGLERGHEPPVHRKGPHDCERKRPERDDKAEAVDTAQAGEPALSGRRNEVRAVKRRRHRAPRARRSWNCSTDSATIRTNSTTDAAAARPPLFIWKPCFRMYWTITIVASVRTLLANR